MVVKTIESVNIGKIIPICGHEWGSLEGLLSDLKLKNGEYVGGYVLKSQLSDFKKDGSLRDGVKQSDHNKVVEF